MVVRPLARLALIALLASPPVVADPVTVQRLEPGGWIFGSWCVDLDGDGRMEILLQIAPAGRRQLALFRQTETGFAAKPDRVVAVPEGAAYYVAGPVGPEDARGVLFLGRGAALFHAWKDGGLDPNGRRLFELQLFPRRAHPDFCYAWRIAGDLDGDGRDDLVLPVAAPAPDGLQGYRVLSRASDEHYAPIASLPVPVRSECTAQPGAIARFRHSLPVPTLTDLDGDGRLDVMFMVGPRMLAYRQAEGRGLHPKPLVDAPLGFLRGVPAGQVALDRLVVADLDGDRKADAIYMRKVGSIGLFRSLRTRISIFLGPFHDKHRPDQILNLPGLARRPRLFDFDGDGDLDMLEATLEVNAFSALRRIVGDTIPAVFRLHAFDRRSRRFEARPRIELARGLEFEDLMDYSPVPLVFLHGDFDGDGGSDLLEAVSEHRIEARAGRPPGGAGGAFAERPIFSAELAYSSENLFLVDLTGEGRTDVVTYLRDQASVVLCR